MQKQFKRNKYDKPVKKTAKLVKSKSGQELILIKFPFDFSTLANIKTLYKREYDSANKTWYCPMDLNNVKKLKSFGFELSEELEMLIPKAHLKNLDTFELDLSHKVKIPGFKGKLFPYQKECINFLEAKVGRALIADEMGLGKTIEAIAYLQLHPEIRPVVIVCPSSVKYNWNHEILKFTEITSIFVLNGRTPTTIPKETQVLIMNYEIVEAWQKEIEKISPKILILDECHYIKNSSAKRTKAIKKLNKNMPYIIALSGTPILNRPIEIFNTINLINKNIFPDKMAFGRRYCGLHHNGFGWDWNGHSRTEELHIMLTNSIMIRRLKAEVLKDLPEKLYSFVPLEINNRNVYNKAENNFISYIKSTKGLRAAHKAAEAETLTQIETLKQLAVNGKLKSLVQWIEYFFESEKKLVVFAHHKFTIDYLYTYFSPKIGTVKLDGSTKNRQFIVEEFQMNRKIRLFIGSGAAAEGLTLTAASSVAITEFPWTPGKLNQMIDRVHRISQKNSVTAFFLPAVNTIEEKLIKLLDKKIKILESVLDGKSIENTTIFQELIEQFKR